MNKKEYYLNNKDKLIRYEQTRRKSMKPFIVCPYCLKQEPMLLNHGTVTKWREHMRECWKEYKKKQDTDTVKQ